MTSEPSALKDCLERSFDAYERPIRIRNYKLGALLAGIFMPAGASLDFFMYDWEQALGFFPARVFSAVLLALVWLALHFLPGTRYYRLLGFSVALIPLLAISWMIYSRDGAASPYYAALNLVLL